MKKLVTCFLPFIMGFLLCGHAYAQPNPLADPGLVDITTTPSALVGPNQPAITTVRYSNIGSDAIPVGAIRIQVDLNQYLNYVSPLLITGFAVTFSDAMTVVLRNTAVIPALTFSGVIQLRTVAVQTTGPTATPLLYQEKPYSANISLTSPVQAGNTNTSNDNVSANIRVGEVVFDPGPLPVTLLSFTGKEVNCSAQLEWKSAGESDLKQYSVEQSADGVNFTAVQTIKGKGGNENVYSVLLGVTGKKAYYRLAILQTDGSRKYSSVVPVQTSCASNQYFAVYPNPVKKGQAITLQSSLAQMVTYKITDAAGKLVETGKFQGITTLSRQLASGVYYVELNTDEATKRTKVVVQ